MCFAVSILRSPLIPSNSFSITTAIEDLRKSINKLELRINVIEKFGDSKPAAPAPSKPAPAKKDDDDDIDLFGSDEEDEEAGRFWCPMF